MHLPGGALMTLREVDNPAKTYNKNVGVSIMKRHQSFGFQLKGSWRAFVNVEFMLITTCEYSIWTGRARKAQMSRGCEEGLFTNKAGRQTCLQHQPFSRPSSSNLLIPKCQLHNLISSTRSSPSSNVTTCRITIVTHYWRRPLQIRTSCLADSFLPLPPRLDNHSIISPHPSVIKCFERPNRNYSSLNADQIPSCPMTRTTIRIEGIDIGNRRAPDRITARKKS